MATTEKRAGRFVLVGLVVTAVVAALIVAGLVVTQWDKWTCGPPEGVWVDAADDCMEVP